MPTTSRRAAAPIGAFVLSFALVFVFGQLIAPSPGPEPAPPTTSTTEPPASTPNDPATAGGSPVTVDKDVQVSLGKVRLGMTFGPPLLSGTVEVGGRPGSETLRVCVVVPERSEITDSEWRQDPRQTRRYCRNAGPGEVVEFELEPV